MFCLLVCDQVIRCMSGWAACLGFLSLTGPEGASLLGRESVITISLGRLDKLMSHGDAFCASAARSCILIWGGSEEVCLLRNCMTLGLPFNLSIVRCELEFKLYDALYFF